MANKFFATREPASHRGPEGVYFAAFVPRSLSIEDAKELASVLLSLTEYPKTVNGKVYNSKAELEAADRAQAAAKKAAQEAKKQGNEQK